MSFESEVESLRSLKVNLVFKIYAPAPTGTTYFSKYQVQSGLTVPTYKVGTAVDTPASSPSVQDRGRVATQAP